MYAKFKECLSRCNGETISGLLDVYPLLLFCFKPLIVTFCMRGRKRISLTRFSSSSARLDGWLYINYTCESLATRITRFPDQTRRRCTMLSQDRNSIMRNSGKCQKRELLGQFVPTSSIPSYTTGVIKLWNVLTNKTKNDNNKTIRIVLRLLYCWKGRGYPVTN